MAIICRDYKLLFIQVPGTGCSSVSKVLKEQLGGEKLPQQDLMLAGKYKLVGEKHNSLEQLVRYNLISRSELKSYLAFATVRNPFDRFATAYQRYVSSWWETMIESDNLDCPANRSGSAYRERYVKNFQKQIELARGEGFENWLQRKIVLPQRLDRRVKVGCKRLLKKQSPLFGKDAVRMNLAYPLIAGVDEVIRFEHLENDFNKILSQVGVDKHIAIPHTNKTPGKKSYREQYSPEARAIVERELGKELARFGYSFEPDLSSDKETSKAFTY